MMGTEEGIKSKGDSVMSSPMPPEAIPQGDPGEQTDPPAEQEEQPNPGASPQEPQEPGPTVSPDEEGDPEQ